MWMSDANAGFGSPRVTWTRRLNGEDNPALADLSYIRLTGGGERPRAHRQLLGCAVPRKVEELRQ